MEAWPAGSWPGAGGAGSGAGSDDGEAEDEETDGEAGKGGVGCGWRGAAGSQRRQDGGVGLGPDGPGNCRVQGTIIYLPMGVVRQLWPWVRCPDGRPFYAEAEVEVWVAMGRVQAAGGVQQAGCSSKSLRRSERTRARGSRRQVKADAPLPPHAPNAVR